MGSWDWVTKQELLCLKTYTKQFEWTNSSFQSQPADSLQCIMALHYTHTHTSYRPFWPPFSPIILLNRAVGVLRDGVIIPPLWHLWPHFQLQSPFTALHIPEHLISDPWPLSFQEFYSSQNPVAVFRLLRLAPSRSGGHMGAWVDQDGRYSRAQIWIQTLRHYANDIVLTRLTCLLAESHLASQLPRYCASVAERHCSETKGERSSFQNTNYHVCEDTIVAGDGLACEAGCN